MASSSGDRRDKSPTSTGESPVMYKTKTIKFFDFFTPIVLQKDNGPCPLIAICNVLLLRNQLTLNLDDNNEVSQQRLIELVGDILHEASHNVNNEDDGYDKSLPEKLYDAFGLLPQLAAGADVNVKFHRIWDFEYTPACALFELLGIPLCHGWLVDPQDHETACAIGSKSYNTLMSDLVSLETWEMKAGSKNKSFDESPPSASNLRPLRRGDAEEAAELLRALKLSKKELVGKGDDTCAAAASGEEVKISPDNPVSGSDDVPNYESPPSASNLRLLRRGDAEETAELLRALKLSKKEMVGKGDDSCAAAASVEELMISPNNPVSGSDDVPNYKSALGKQAASAVTDSGQGQSNQFISTATSSLAIDTMHDEGVKCFSTPLPDSVDGSHKQGGEGNYTSDTSYADSESASGIEIGGMESFASNVGSDEPIYEGEDSSRKDLITHQGELISNFLKNNATQLTIYGLFCLQEGLDDGELCVFFRNNHFNTMFKFGGELFLLATDQGYLNQHDLVWEKLNEVNGDTQFVTSDFKVFRPQSSSNRTWDMNVAISDTHAFLYRTRSSLPALSDEEADLKLAIAQQKELLEARARVGSRLRHITGSKEGSDDEDWPDSGWEEW